MRAAFSEDKRKKNRPEKSALSEEAFYKSTNGLFSVGVQTSISPDHFCKKSEKFYQYVEDWKISGEQRFTWKFYKPLWY